ncbi:hypothetical protein N2152v2_002798 [Parachlorella kessleri]
MKLFTNKPWPWAVVVLACMAGAARADDVVIGGGSGWKLGVTYTDLTVKQGDTLVFNYNPSAHDVYRLPSGACNFDSSAVRVDAGSSPARVTLDQPGTYWYACSKPGHCDGGMLQKVVVEAAAVASPSPEASPSPAYDEDYGYYTNLTTWFNWNPRYDYLYQYLSANHADVLSGDYPVTIFVPIGSNKTWEDALWPLSLPSAFYPRLVVPYAYKSYDELVEAGPLTTYDNTTINFSYNEYEEVLGEWQDKTQAKAYVDYAAYPYGKSVVYAIRPYSWAPRPSPSPIASPDYTPSPDTYSPSPVPTPSGYRRLQL